MKNYMTGFLGGAIFVFILTLYQGAYAEEIDVKLENGLHVLGTLTLAEGKDLQNDGVVLFVHGTLAHKGMGIVENQSALLVERDLNVLAINLSLGIDRRTGMYDCALAHRHKHREAFGEIDAWLKWLKDQGASSVVMMGHSRGANQVAWHASEHDNDMVRKIVLVAPQTWSETYQNKDYQKRYHKDVQVVLKKMLSKSVAGQGADIIEGLDFIYCAGAQVTPAAFVDYYAADERMNTPFILPSLQKPVLVVAGSDDTVVSDLPKQMTKINQSNIIFSIVEDAGHMFIDFAGEDLADQVAEFILSESDEGKE